MGRRKFENDVSAPGLADDYRSVESKFTDQYDKIVHNRCEVVAIVGFI
ncbi:unannotated protein [freshwater metagenome]|uniref:Unannotated protein n=1 Tax=freshwater metagenome TaxID=449393 RepID=A0A6J6FI89_9ZZZZ